MTITAAATSEMDHLDLAAARARKAAGSAWRRGPEGQEVQGWILGRSKGLNCQARTRNSFPFNQGKKPEEGQTACFVYTDVQK